MPRTQAPYGLLSDILTKATENGVSLPQIELSSLKTGDYSIKGFENEICIERKASVSELASNITEKRFQREIERMSEIRHPFIFLEFSMREIDRYPFCTNLPPKIRRKIRVRGPFIRKKLEEYLLNWNIQTFCCRDAIKAEVMAYNILADFFISREMIQNN